MKVEAVEVDATRKSFCISTVERIRNEVINQRIDIEGDIIEDINIKQLIWNGHVH